MTAQDNTLTQARLKEVLKYNPDTGHFTWKTSGGWRSAQRNAGHKKRTGYRCIRIDGIIYMEHNLAVFYMTGSWPTHEVDHKNHIRSDNYWDNLRCVTHIENTRNATMSTNNTSGVCGVSYHNGKWRARIKHEGRDINGGHFNSKQEAVARRKALEKEYGFHTNHGMHST